MLLEEKFLKNLSDHTRAAVVIKDDGNGTREYEIHPSKKGAVAGAMAGAAMGSVVPVIGTAVGATVGGIIGFIFGPSK